MASDSCFRASKWASMLMSYKSLETFFFNASDTGFFASLVIFADILVWVLVAASTFSLMVSSLVRS